MAGIKPLSASHRRDLEWIQGFSDPAFGPGTLSNACLKALTEHGFIAPIEDAPEAGWHRVLTAKERAAVALLAAKQAANDAACAIQVALDLAFSDSAGVSVCDDIRGAQQHAWDIAEYADSFNKYYVQEGGRWHNDW